MDKFVPLEIAEGPLAAFLDRSSQDEEHCGGLVAVSNGAGHSLCICEQKHTGNAADEADSSQRDANIGIKSTARRFSASIAAVSTTPQKAGLLPPISRSPEGV